jgi:sugar lactone lactonase YvrE
MGANGMYFGPDDKLHLASVVSSAIMIIDTKSGAISALPAETAKLVVTPDDLAFNNEGTMCWTDITQGHVGCMEPNGDSSIRAKMTPGNNPITFSNDGRLFVGQCFFGHELYEVYLQGDKPPRLITDKLQDSADEHLQCGFNGMDLGPDGKLYGPRWFKNEVTRLDVDSGEFETYVSGFEAPASVKFDAQGVLHVLDSGAGKVYSIDENLNKTVVANLTPGLDNMAFSSDGRLFVSSYADGYVAEILAQGKHRKVTPAGLSMAGSALITARNGKPELAISDYNSVRFYDLGSGEEIYVVRDIIDFPNKIGNVLSIGAAQEGQLIIGSWINLSLKLWDVASASSLYNLTKQDTAAMQTMIAPINAVLYMGEIVFTDFATQSVRSVVPEKGSSISTRYSPPENKGQKTPRSLPAGLNISPDNSLYMTDNIGGSVLKLADKGQWLDTPVTIATGLSKPEGLHVSEQMIYVVEVGSQQVSAINLASGEIRPVATGLNIGIPALSPQMPPTMLFSGITQDAQGRLYLPSDIGNFIYRITPPG